ncbi:MAG TPA: cytochrome c [Vicinamibacterales bacterium]|nr:cytochrome c [Vicinamibacterales bacterium]
MTITAQKYLVAALSLLLLVAIVAAGSVESRLRLEAAQAGAARTGPLDPALDRGRQLYEKYSCIACHGAGGIGGVYNANAQTGGMINGVRFVAETYTKDDLTKKILDGVPVVPKANPNGPNPPLAMPSYRGIVGVEEMRELVDYLFSLRPPGESTQF